MTSTCDRLLPVTDSNYSSIGRPVVTQKRTGALTGPPCELLAIRWLLAAYPNCDNLLAIIVAGALSACRTCAVRFVNFARLLREARERLNARERPTSVYGNIPAGAIDAVRNAPPPSYQFNEALPGIGSGAQKNT